MRPWAREVVALAQDYERGVLPRKGGLYDQANWYVQAVRIALGAQIRIRKIREEEKDGNTPAPFSARLVGGANLGPGVSHRPAMMPPPSGKRRRPPGRLTPFDRPGK